MTAYSVIVAKSPRKRLSQLPPHIQQRIKNNLKSLSVNPDQGLKLFGQFKNYKKLRVGDYRIIYSINKSKQQISILKIEHRQGVYK